MRRLFEKKFVIGFMFAYTAIFSIYAFFTKNFEFVYYTIIMILLILYIYKKQNSLWLSNNIVIGLAIFGLLHIFGGGFYLNGTRVYDLNLFLGINYDNLVHGVGIFVITFVSYNLLRPHVDKHIIKNRVSLVILLLLLSMGIGAINELVEFGAVLFFDAETRVGDFYNTGYDLVSNLVGAIVAIAFIPPFREKRFLIKLARKYF